MCWMRPTCGSEHALADAFEGWDVYYAAKSFLCATVARWVSDEGLGVDVCTGGELAVVQRAGLDPQRVGLHGNNKSVEELREALTIGVGRIIVDSFDEIARLGVLAEELRIRPRVMVRATTGVEAHTHEYIATAHEDQKFGFSIAGGIAGSLYSRAIVIPGSISSVSTHIGSQIFDAEAFEVAARRTSGCTISQLRPACNWPNWTSGRLRHRLHQCRHTIHTRCPGGGTSGDRPRMLSTRQPSRTSIEPGRAISGPSTFALYRVGTVKPVALDGGASRLYVAVDGGMSDNIRTALYAAEYSATLASRRSAAPPVLARVVGKHCEGGDILVRMSSFQRT